MATSAICSIPDCNKKIMARDLCAAHYSRLIRNGSPTGGRAPHGSGIAFISAVMAGAAIQECIAWPFGRTAKGLATVHYQGRKRIASAVVCELKHGAPPTPEHQAAHSCGKGNDGCINPEHLRWATRIENEADKLIHGTRLMAENQPMAKLTNAQVRQIRAMGRDVSDAEVARLYGISRSGAGFVRTRKTYPSVI